MCFALSSLLAAWAAIAGLFGIDAGFGIGTG